MLNSYGYIGLLLIVAILFPFGAIAFSTILGLLRVRPNNPNPIKNSTYECGVDPIGDSWTQFNFRYYLYALMFVVFSVETVFLYPWAVAFKKLALFGFVEVAIFIAILVVGFVYAWKKKALEWQ